MLLADLYCECRLAEKRNLPIDHDPFPASLPLPDDPVKEGVRLRLCLVVGEMLPIAPHRDVHPRRVTGLAGADGQDVLQIDRRIEDAEYVWILQMLSLSLRHPGRHYWLRSAGW